MCILLAFILVYEFSFAEVSRWTVLIVVIY
jgi:hypothetical protein